MMHRRELLLVGAGALAAKATATAIACASEPTVEGKDAPKKKKDAPEKKEAHEHEGHEGHAPEGDEAAAAPADGVTEFVKLAAACVAAGNVCLPHCIRRLADGDTSMGDCGKTVSQMLPVCEMVGALAAAHSDHLPTAAKLCHDVCSSCAAACKPHVGHHAECKQCYEACQATIAEAKKHMA